MAVGDVYVTATFMMVLSATLIVGNIIADMLLALLDPRVRAVRRGLICFAFDSSPATAARADVPRTDGHGRAATATKATSALVWRRLRRSWTGMMGLILVGLLLVMADLRGVLRADGSEGNGRGLRAAAGHELPRQGRQLRLPAAGHAVRPIPARLDPVTFQPVVGPDYDNPERYLGFFVAGRRTTGCSA